jgi:diguanylate cyclase (GGDEF)-like protein
MMLILCVFGAARALADCPSLPDAKSRELDALTNRDAKRALGQIQTELATLESKPQTAPAQIAVLYAAQANAYSLLELDREARDSATKGLALAPVQTDPVHVNLLIGYWQNVYDEANLDQAVTALEAAKKAQPPGSRAEVCLLSALGVVQLRRDRADLAISNLTQAYRATMSAGSVTNERIVAAGGLATVMRYVGDYVQALALNQEVIDWDSAHGASLALSVDRFLRGQTYNAMRNYTAAIEQLTQARALSVELDDQQGIAFADEVLCSARIELGQLITARSQCEQALRVFAAAQTIDMIKVTQTLLAHIDLSEGHADAALKKLNSILDNGGADIPARELANIYELRARTNAALGNYAPAFRDLDTYVERIRAVNDGERTRQAAALRAQLETDREIERNGVLQRELALSRERWENQTIQLRWTRIAIAAGVTVIGLLTYILLANVRYRRLLVRLANHDDLTGLPNRRRTSELAAEALKQANATGKSLTLALLDFDHFKEINDHCGHACGDFVLKEFARLARPVLRAGDTLGRWGGEEFLLILPDCTLDSAYLSVQRLRTLALGIKLPPSALLLSVSLSAGLATNTMPELSLEEIIASADVALYEAKSAGRDLVRVSRSSFHSASSGVRRALQRELGDTATSRIA